jgi:DNA repair photolyase
MNYYSHGRVYTGCLPIMSTLFDSDAAPRKTALGRAKIEYRAASSILTPTSGYMDTYDFTLNPYSGCTFGCSYCYAAFFARSEEKVHSWGYWLEVKENALELLKKRRKKPLDGKVVYMSSVTDPYLPLERDLRLSRAILEELWEHHPGVRLVMQTRSPLIVRDVDLFKRFERLQVNMTITTDSETVRKTFEPLCPSNKVRLNAVRELVAAGLLVCVTLTPLLPVENPDRFADALVETGCKEYIIHPFQKEKGRFVSGTRQEGLQLFERMGWDDEKYAAALNVLRSRLPRLREDKAGIAPLI